MRKVVLRTIERKARIPRPAELTSMMTLDPSLEQLLPEPMMKQRKRGEPKPNVQSYLVSLHLHYI